MRKSLHRDATTAARNSQTAQNCNENLKILVKRRRANPWMDAKSRKHSWVNDLPIGPEQPKPTALLVEEKTMTFVFPWRSDFGDGVISKSGNGFWWTRVRAKTEALPIGDAGTIVLVGYRGAA